jgi:hypothetical protein
LIEICKLVLEKIFFNSVYFFSSAIISPWAGIALHLNNFERPTLKDDLCQVWLELALWLWKKEIFKQPRPIFTFL